MDMFASVKSNDMTSFKAWLDAGGDGIDKEVNAIQYDYGVRRLSIVPARAMRSLSGSCPTP